MRINQNKNKYLSLIKFGVLFIMVCILLINLISVVTGNIPDDTDQTPIDIETDRVSINIHTEQTTVGHDDTVVFIHSITNYVTNEKDLTVQLILEAPQGSQVRRAANADTGTGSQYTTTTTLDPGDQESMRITTDLNEPGTNEITGEVIYFFGDNPENGVGKETTISVEQRPPPPSTTERVVGAHLDVYHWISSSLTTRLTTDGFIGYNPLSVGIYVIILVFLSSIFLFLCTTLTLPLMLLDIEISSESWGDFVVGGAILIGVLALLFTAIEFSSGQVNNPLLPRLLAGLITLIPLLVLINVVLIGVTRWLNGRRSSY